MPGMKKKTAILILIILVFTGICVSGIAISMKKGMHVDEYYSYGLSNNMGSEIHMTVELGKRYETPHETFDEYMTVGTDHRFSYENVWDKQAADVHPPVYYAILHTICSFFPGSFSIWFAASMNLMFFAGVIVFVYTAMLELSNNHKTALISAGFCALSGGLIQINTFLRMYTMLMFLVAALTWLHLKYYKKQTTKFFILYPAIIFFGILTHYYFLIFLVLQGVYFGISLLLRKRWKSAGLYLSETIIVSGISFAVFPAMAEHILWGYRGQESIDNLLESTGYLNGLLDFWKILSQNLTGSLLIIIVVLYTGTLLYQYFKKKDAFDVDITAKWGMLWLPALVYYLLISKIAVYHYDRYISVIYPVLILIITGMISHIIRITFSTQKAVDIVLCSILGSCIILSYIGCDWSYLQTDTAQMVDIANEYSEYDCIVINNGINFWNHTLYYEVENYKSLTFLSNEQLSMYSNSEAMCPDPVVVYVLDCVGDHNAVLEQLMKQNQTYSETIHIVDSNFAKGYLIK